MRSQQHQHLNAIGALHATTVVPSGMWAPSWCGRDIYCYRPHTGCGELLTGSTHSFFDQTPDPYGQRLRAVRLSKRRFHSAAGVLASSDRSCSTSSRPPSSSTYRTWARPKRYCCEHGQQTGSSSRRHRNSFAPERSQDHNRGIWQAETVAGMRHRAMTAGGTPSPSPASTGQGVARCQNVLLLHGCHPGNKWKHVEGRPVSGPSGGLSV